MVFALVWMALSRRQCGTVRPFIEQYGIAEEEHVKAADAFTSFNEFFYRKLKPAARPVDAAADSVVFPADGRHLGFAKASAMEGVYVKGSGLISGGCWGTTIWQRNSPMARRCFRGCVRWIIIGSIFQWPVCRAMRG